MESNEVSESNINVEIKNSETSENENIDDSQIRNDNMSNNKNEIKYDPEIEAKNYFNTLTDEEKKKLASVITYIKGQNHQLNEKEIEEIFKKLDIHNNNKITFEDLQKFLSVLRSKVNNYYINEIIREYGKDSKEISKETFIEKMKESIKGKYKKENY